MPVKPTTYKIPASLVPELAAWIASAVWPSVSYHAAGAAITNGKYSVLGVKIVV